MVLRTGEERTAFEAGELGAVLNAAVAQEPAALKAREGPAALPEESAPPRTVREAAAVRGVGYAMRLSISSAIDF